MFHRRVSSSIACLLAVVVCLIGCRGHRDALREVRANFHAGQLDQATQQLDRTIPKARRDEIPLRLDGAIVHLAAGRPKQAEQELRVLRDRLDYLRQKSLAESVAASLTDDRARAYAGEDYERICLRAFLAMSNLMGDRGDALAYCFQLTDEQNRVLPAGGVQEASARATARRVALAPYLYAALREESHTAHDEVERARGLVAAWNPQFPAAKQDLDRARFGRHSEPGNGVVYVIAMVGRGPIKRETVSAPTSTALLIADQILSQLADHTLPPTIAPVTVAEVVRSPNTISDVGVSIDGRQAGRTATITDVTGLAIAQCRADFDRTLARAVVRRVIKKGSIYALKNQLEVEKGTPLDLGLNVAGILWEATEQADTRHWGLLPDTIQVLRLELPAGRHRLALTPLGTDGPLAKPRARPIPIDDGRNTYVLAFLPESQPVGDISVSK